MGCYGRSLLLQRSGRCGERGTAALEAKTAGRDAPAYIDDFSGGLPGGTTEDWSSDVNAFNPPPMPSTEDWGASNTDWSAPPVAAAPAPVASAPAAAAPADNWGGDDAEDWG